MTETMCNRCPRRDMADLFEAMGSDGKAAEIRAAGCPWWWAVKGEDAETGQESTRLMCGAEALPHYLRSYGMDVVRSVNAVQADREEQAKALALLDDTLAALGVPETISLLAQLGMRAAVAQRQLAERTDREDGG